MGVEDEEIGLGELGRVAQLTSYRACHLSPRAWVIVLFFWGARGDSWPTKCYTLGTSGHTVTLTSCEDRVHTPGVDSMTTCAKSCENT